MGPTGGSNWPPPRFPRRAFSRRQENRRCGSRGGAAATGRASWIGGSERLKLLVGGLGAAVPRLRKMRDGRAEVQVVERRGALAERLVGHRPDSPEYLAAQKPCLLG